MEKLQLESLLHSLPCTFNLYPVAPFDSSLSHPVSLKCKDVYLQMHLIREFLLNLTEMKQ